MTGNISIAELKNIATSLKDDQTAGGKKAYFEATEELRERMSQKGYNDFVSSL